MKKQRSRVAPRRSSQSTPHPANRWRRKSATKPAASTTAPVSLHAGAGDNPGAPAWAGSGQGAAPRRRDRTWASNEIDQPVSLLRQHSAPGPVLGRSAVLLREVGPGLRTAGLRSTIGRPLQACPAEQGQTNWPPVLQRTGGPVGLPLLLL